MEACENQEGKAIIAHSASGIGAFFSKDYARIKLDYFVHI